VLVNLHERHRGSADARAIDARGAARSTAGLDRRAAAMRRIGIRFWLVGAFAAVTLVVAGVVYLFGDRPRAVLGAIALGVLVGFMIAVGISHRVTRLSRAAGELAAGAFDAQLEAGGRDEIGDLARALDSMRASLKESFGVLTADRNKLEAIFDGLTDAVVVVDEDGQLRFSNRAAAQLLDPTGLPVEALLPHLARASDLGFAAHPALRIGDRAYAMTARSLPNERAVLAVIRDRTEEMRRELAEADFISNAAHELRNPLAGISSAIEVLQEGAKDDPGALDHFLGRLAEDTERMNRLTRALLTLARVESVGAREVEVVDVPAAIRDVAEAVEAPRGVELNVAVERDLTAKGDPTLLRQVLVGLLTNAFKHTSPPGSVTVRGRREGNSEVILEVVDTGTGIPEVELERVFERFYRRTESRNQEGFGLGLAIARRMVDVMGGEIGARSVEGRGSTFWVRLPIAEPSPTPVA